MENRTFRSPGNKNPELIVIKLDVGDYVRDLTPHTKFGAPIPTGSGAAYA